jgi:hypothetical protein
VSSQNSSREWLGLFIFLSVVLGYCIAWLVALTF